MSVQVRGSGRRRRVGLRQRVVAGFACGAFVLSASLSILTYEMARSYLLGQRERSIIARTYASAGLVGHELLSPAPDIPRVISSLVLPAGSYPVLLHEGRWFAASLQVGRDDVPVEIADQASEGRAVRQIIRLREVPHLAVGVPLPAGEGVYIEVSSLEDLDRTLNVLRNALAVAAAVTILVGAGAGTWAGRRLLRPLSTAAQAAAAVESGRLDVRLNMTGDADLDKLAEAFNGMTSALAERIERDARFASAVSHELRSPLTTLATSVEVLRGRREDMPERAQAALDFLAADVRRFQRLVEDLLEMSRIQAGFAEVLMVPVRPQELVAHVLRSANTPEVPIAVDPSASNVLVTVDKRRMERAIVNLVENAQTHGGGILQMTIDADDTRVRLAVEDAGPGVAHNDRQRIFEPFVRGRAAGRRGRAEGTGLGLALVAEHVRLQGGRVWMEDRVEGGSRFVIELPVTVP